MRRGSLWRFFGNRSLLTVGLTLLAAALLVVAGWTILKRTALDNDGESPTTTIWIPAEIPIPPGAAIGENTVDSDLRIVTVELVTTGTLIEAVSTHTIGLVSAGYVVDVSEALDDGWVLRFSSIDLRGTIELHPVAVGISAVITVRDP